MFCSSREPEFNFQPVTAVPGRSNTSGLLKDVHTHSHTHTRHTHT
ncbi:rCG40017 [Rattus norvegicus]|uniref:RCG40017 n=1 Tax=Rattus norvegicus TaxID=10116 RepID=A6I7W4_RAT|nr:rCG40017 [Rattus norvegicus]